MSQPLAEPGVCNGTALRKATRRVSQLYDAVLAPTGLRGTQRSILIHIARAQMTEAGSPSMGALAAALVLDRSALAHNLKPLERDGLVAVEVDPADRRGRIVVLTELGRTRLDATTPLWAEAQRRFEASFGDAAALRAALALIASPEFAAAFEAA